MRIDIAPRASRREWLGLAVLALPTLLLSLDISVLYLAVPQLSADLGASSTEQLWIMDSYGFMIAGFLVTMGTLGDRIGRRKLLLIGAAAFGVASVVAAYATSPGTLIGARALLGIAGATLMPSTLALISNMFRDAAQRGLAVAVWMSCFMVGATVGPIVGGVLLENFWWGSAFLLGVPVMLLLLVLGPVLLPEYRTTAAGRLDLASVALSLGAILLIIYGLKEIARSGSSTWPVAAVVAGTALGVVFVRRQRTLPEPLLDLRLLGNRCFGAALTTGLVTGIVMGGTVLFVALYLQLVLGLSPLQAGLWQVPQALAMIVGSMLTPVIARRIRPAFVMAAGLAVAAAGLLVLTQVGSGAGLAVLVVGFVITSAGLGPAISLSTGLVLSSAPPDKAGSASSMSETSGELGIALGVATLGSLGTAVYRSRLAETTPSGVPTDAIGTARESIAGAVAVAERLPDPLGADLLQAANDAFAAALNVAAGVGAVLFVGLAVLTATALRHARAGDEPRPDHAEAGQAAVTDADDLALAAA